MKIIFLILPLLFSTALQAGCSSVNLKVGDKAPEFALVNQDGTIVHLSDFLGSKVALYFYPKDNTPGCSQQACSLRDDFEQLEDAGITILGLSKGSIKSKQSFIKKKHLNFPLLIATNDVLKAYGVNTGLLRLYLPKRWTFLVNEDGIIVAIIKDVDTKHHAEQILDAFNAGK
ncbi:MAG TPA: peroxiredoxin [Candidatus Babeliales bacterium]|nr:peroxiredoxin [Candidatus Babeliales bacterium]